MKMRSLLSLCIHLQLDFAWTCASETEISSGGVAQSSRDSSSNTAQPLSDPFLRILSASSIKEVLEMGLLYKGKRLGTDELGAGVDLKRNRRTLVIDGK
ncbi:hypothetical protein PoB_000459000 [Plakobranchus ocellatus]|uniref:Uncharacterized protein n=1 Tax=Plakobranchus ocellatus TaxID=259542 RepID=A0AAV3Y6H0_9GAST|nr:hypothetical protein PoB_000459000 [Plakobranchus ocellatus]